MLFMLNMLDFKNDENQINFPFMIYAEFKAFQCQKIMKGKIKKSLIR